MKKYAIHTTIIIAFLLCCWQFGIWVTHIPNYFLPSPWRVLYVLWEKRLLLAMSAKTTLIEALLGFFYALVLGCFAALIFYRYRALGFLFWPILVISQALPTLAIAPLLVLWLGYGLSSKIVLVAIMLFFPITSAFLDGLHRVNPLWLNLAKLMTSKRWSILWRIEIPAALPHLASGIRIAAAGAMMGAIIGEWIGASEGLGFLLLEANARFETDLVFADIVVLVVLSLVIYWGTCWLLKRLITW